MTGDAHHDADPSRVSTTCRTTPGCGCVADPGRTAAVVHALVRPAAFDGGRDDAALLLLRHLLSGVVWKLAGQLHDLGPGSDRS